MLDLNRVHPIILGLDKTSLLYEPTLFVFLLYGLEYFIIVSKKLQQWNEQKPCGFLDFTNSSPFKALLCDPMAIGTPSIHWKLVMT
jgi:hypothetical protein